MLKRSAERDSSHGLRIVYNLQIDVVVAAMLWTLPVGDADFPTRWRRVKTDFSRALACTERRSAVRVGRGERGVWQRRYWEHQIRDDADYARHFDYIHYNPVKHGWARSPALWLHSSFDEMVARGVYHRDWASPVAFDVGGDG